jgi:heat shock protein HslJ
MKNTATKAILLVSLVIGATVTAFSAERFAIENKRWELVEAYGQSARKSSAYVEINGARFTGNTGCNQMFGAVDLQRGSKIDFKMIGTTKRMCKMLAGSIPEMTVLKGLNDAAKYTLTGERLSLTDRRGRTLLRFKAVKGENEARIDLEDRKWMLESIAGRQVFVPITGVFINFDAAKSGVGGNTGCNVFGGKFTANGSRLSIAEVISTMRACEQAGKMQTERELLDGLRRADRYEFANNRLNLYRGKQLLLTFRGERK